MWQAMSWVSNKVELFSYLFMNLVSWLVHTPIFLCHFSVQEVTAYYSVQIIIAVVPSFLKGELQMIC